MIPEGGRAITSDESAVRGIEGADLSNPRRTYVLVPILWLLFVLIVALSSNSLGHVVYWAAFFGFAAIMALLVLTGGRGTTEGSEGEDYLFRIGRRWSILLGVIGISSLFVLAVIMNAPFPNSVKAAVFLGAVSGMVASIACSVTCIEVVRYRHAT